MKTTQATIDRILARVCEGHSAVRPEAMSMVQCALVTWCIQYCLDAERIEEVRARIGTFGVEMLEELGQDKG